MDAIALHADTSRAALMHGAALSWQPSPSPGVDRKLLERIGGEVALATSIVRYAPESRFPPHTHGAGEEFLVLDGVFSDEYGDYPPMTYVRNPPGSVHTPRSDAGCTIFVKLRQMNASEHERIVVPGDPARYGRQLLHHGSAVMVELHRLRPGDTLELDARVGGEEVFVYDGALSAPGIELDCWSWWRRPPCEGNCVLTTRSGAIVWRKRGHLDRNEG